MPKLRLAILGSTRGTSMQAIIDAIVANQLQASIELVISNKADAYILERAKQNYFTTLCIDTQQGMAAFEAQLSQRLHAQQIDLLVLIGFMRILSSSFVAAWPNKIINVHPSLLPHGAGLRDLVVHQWVLQQGHTRSGCSVHYVTDEVDKGPILLQKQCPVLPEDTVDSLKIRVQLLEGMALVEAINALHAAKAF